MKKAIAIIILGLLVSTNAYSAKTKFTKGQIYEGEINWNNKMKINLPPGKWEVIDKWAWGLNAFSARATSFVQMDGNRVIASFSLAEFLGGGKYIGQIALIVYEVLFKNKYDGCYERSEYTLVKVFKRGMSINCFVVGHSDVNKELYHPDDPETKVNSAIVRKWIRENNIEVPKIMLDALGVYFAPSVTDAMLGWDYSIDPEVFGASKNKFTTEDTSEYHPANINRYPDKKKFMENWIKIAAQRHKNYEMVVGAKEHHKLDFSSLGIERIKKIKSTSKKTKETKKTDSSSSTTRELKECVKLFKANELTKKQFENCKDKVLNQ